MPIRCEPTGYGNVQGRPVTQLVHTLHGALPIRFFADQDGPVLITQRSRDDFGCAGGSSIDQDHHRPIICGPCARLYGVRSLLAAPLVLYVSCSPPTLARDLAKLCASGYGVESLELYDFFPNTYHVETLAVLSRPE